MKQNFILPLLNARRNYDVSRILDENDLLNKLIIDGYYNTERYPFLSVVDYIMPRNYSDAYKKYNPEINSEKIISNWSISLKFKLGMWLNSQGDYYKTQIEAYKSLCQLTINYLIESKLQEFNIYSLDTASVELFEWVKGRPFNAKLFLEQCVAPRSEQRQVYLSLNKSKASKVIKSQLKHFNKLSEREIEEWKLADVIIAPSEYVRKSILKENIEESKVKLVPYGYDMPYPKEFIEKNLEEKFSNPRKKIQILFVGNAGYRKGLHDFIEVANRLSNLNIEFKVAGKMENTFILPNNVKNVEFLGKLNRAQLNYQYSQTDIFLFPSYLEGSALSTYEAMAWGIPTITTLEAGSVIRDGLDGYIVTAGSVDEILQKVKILSNDINLRYTMALNTLNNIQEYSLNKYMEKLLNLFV